MAPVDDQEESMQEDVKKALSSDRVIDITTIGRKSGDPSRKEIWFHNVEGDIYITGTPGARDWYANLIENPDFTFHLKESTWPIWPRRRDRSRTRVKSERSSRRS
ncbi:MAG: nitroreductase/quinone reductase family protein [Thermomicrobiales bacterium]